MKRLIRFKVELECNTEFTQNEPRFIEVDVECEVEDDLDTVGEKITAAFEAQQFAQRVIGAIQSIVEAEITSPTL